MFGIYLGYVCHMASKVIRKTVLPIIKLITDILDS